MGFRSFFYVSRKKTHQTNWLYRNAFAHVIWLWPCSHVHMCVCWLVCVIHTLSSHRRFQCCDANFMCIAVATAFVISSAFSCPSITTTSNVWHFQHINIETIVYVCASQSTTYVRHRVDSETSQPRTRVTSNSEFTCALRSHTNTNTQQTHQCGDTTNKQPKMNIQQRTRNVEIYFSHFQEEEDEEKIWFHHVNEIYTYLVCVRMFYWLGTFIYLGQYTTFSIAFCSSLSNTSLKCCVFVSFFERIFFLPPRSKYEKLTEKGKQTKNIVRDKSAVFVP